MPFYDAIRIGSSAVSDVSYSVDRSLRFNRDDNAYLSRTPSSAGNRKTFTFSAWVKLGQTGINTSTNEGNGLFLSCGAGSGGANMTYRITNNGYIGVDYYGIGGYYSTGRLRDPSAWYHCVWVMDTSESTAADRFKVYVNGNLFYNNQLGLSQNADTPLNNNSATTIGAYSYSTSNAYRLDAYLAEVHFLDGYAYDPSYFAETNAATGQWNPKEYTGSYGSNGFYLNFSDNSGTTATTMGKDSSGNSNNFTPSNFTTGDAVKDSPSNNFCVFNPLSKDGGTTLTEGNLKISSTDYDNNTGTFFVTSGKWYWEGLGSGYVIAICGNDGQNFQGSASGTGSKSIGYWFSSGIAYWDGGNSGTGTSYSTSDIVAAALDMDNGTIKFYKNNSLIHDLTFGSGTVPDLSAGVFPVYNNGQSSGTKTANYNFGQDSSFAGNKTAQGNTDGNGRGDFYYSPPTGYKALCSANLPDPTILLPDRHFDTFTYSGDGNSTQTLSNVLEFQPDWVWLKGSNTGYSHTLYDSRRGAGSLKALNSNETRPEGSTVQDDSTFGFLSSFDANGITVTKGSDATSYTNGASSEYVAWNWLAGGADSKTYKVKVVADSTDYGHGTGSNKYQFFKSDGTTGFGTNAVDLDLEEGGTYVFDWSDSSAQSHPIRFSLTNDGTHSSGTSAGTEYTTGVTKDDSAYKTTITIAGGVANLFYYCQNHSGMGAEINTNTTKGSTNFDGSLLSVVKANTTAGFSLVSFTVASSAAYTVGHGLGVAPRVIIMKSRTQTFNWDVFHASVGNTKRIRLNDDTAPEDYTGPWNDTDPTSTVFSSVGSWLNNSSDQIAYIFSEVAGYSKFGSYTGNGSSDGIYVNLGFRPAFVLQRRTDSSGHWYIFDNKRAGFNVDNKSLSPNLGVSQYTVSVIDLLSNGFKLRSNAVAHNASGGTYLYFAFAESPFKNARAR